MTMPIDVSKRTNDITSLHKLNWQTSNNIATGCRDRSVTVNNSPIQEYVHPDNHTQSIYEMTPGFKPFTIINTLTQNFFSAGREHWKV